VRANKKTTSEKDTKDIQKIIRKIINKINFYLILVAH
jgi:hypothetical protein